jgi:cytochrome c-type biogenesis protein CcmH/NrfF
MRLVGHRLLPALLGFALVALPVFAADWGYDLAGELMSPYCPGRALSECPSPDAEKLRAWILAQEEAGRSRADVEAELFLQFGEQLRQAPKAEGVGLIAYAIPVAVFALGGLIVAVFLRRGSRPAVAAPLAMPQALEGEDEELERFLDDELKD